MTTKQKILGIINLLLPADMELIQWHQAKCEKPTDGAVVICRAGQGNIDEFGAKYRKGIFYATSSGKQANVVFWRYRRIGFEYNPKFY